MKIRLILISCFLSIVPLFLVQTYQYFKDEKLAMIVREQDNDRELKITTEDISNTLSTSLDTVSLLSQLSLSSISLEYNRPEALNEYLTLFNKRYSQFKRIAVFDSSKEFFTATAQKNVFELIENIKSFKEVFQELQINSSNELVTFMFSDDEIPKFLITSKIFNKANVLVGFLIGELDNKVLTSQLLKLSTRLKSISGNKIQTYFLNRLEKDSTCSSIKLLNSKDLFLCFDDEQLSPWFWLNSSSITLVVILIALVLIYFLLYSYFIGRVLRPLYTFLNNITDFTKGEFRPQSKDSKYSEINKLIEASNIIGTKLKNFQEAEIERTKNEAVALTAEKVAHDIRSPLTSLEFIVDILGKSLSEKERLTAKQALDRISDILRTLGNKKHNKENNEAKVEILDPLVKRIIAEKRLEFKSKDNIEIVLNNFLPYGSCVKISKADFYRTMSNLINNSAEAAQLNKKLFIDITLTYKEKYCIIIIKDNGKGIPNELISNALLHGTSIDKPNGSGIGLTSAKETIEKYNGSLSIASDINIGTIVTIKLPIVKAPDWFQTRLVIPTKNICIIDDDDSIHAIWDKILSQEKLNITHIKSSNDFQNWISSSNKNQFSFLFDLELLGSKLNGLDIIEEFELQSLSTLVTSHYDNIEVQEKALKLGVKIIPKDSAANVPLDFDFKSS